MIKLVKNPKEEWRREASPLLFRVLYPQQNLYCYSRCLRMIKFLIIFALVGIANSLLLPQIQSAIAADGIGISTQKRTKIIVGIKDNLPPLGFHDRNGNLAGLEIDIARELAKELNLPLELVPLKNRDRLSALQDNQVDLAIAQVTVTTNRSRLVDFSLPYYTDSTVVIARRDMSLQELAQPLAIGVIKNSAAIAVIQSQLPKAVIIGTSSYSSGLAALKVDKIKAFVGDRTSLMQWLSQNPDYAIIGKPLAVHSFAIALPRGLQHLELREQVFAVVNKWRKSGWLKERATYWGL